MVLLTRGIVDFLHVLGGCGEQTCGGDIIDLSRHACGIVMDEVFGLGFEDFV